LYLLAIDSHASRINVVAMVAVVVVDVVVPLFFSMEKKKKRNC